MNTKWWENYSKEAMVKYIDRYQPITRLEADFLEGFWIKTKDGFRPAACRITVNGADTSGIEGWFARRGAVVPMRGYNGIVEPVDKAKKAAYEQIIYEKRI